MPAKSPEAIARKRVNEKLSRRANPEKIASMNKSYRDNRTPEKVADKNQKMKEWREKNIGHVNAYAKKKRDNLNPSYVSLKIGLPLNATPSELLEAKKEQILLKRAIKEMGRVLGNLARREKFDPRC